MISPSVRVFGLACSVLSLCALPARAQEKGRDEKAATIVVPVSALPPAGLCRVWLRDVPAGQQPAPTDCTSAIRKAPPSATVLFGDPKNEMASPMQSRSVAPGAGGRMNDGPGRGLAPAPRGFAPGAREGAREGVRVRTAPFGGPHNPSAGAPPAPAHPPAAAPARKPPEKPLS